MQEGEAKTNWQFTGGADDGQSKAGSKKAVKAVTWTASEYIEHDKSASWYIYFVLVALAGIGGVYVLTRDIVSVLILGLLAVGFVIFAARKPQVLQYQLDSTGITIGTKFYPINLFRSFAIIEEGAFRSITLLPMKRFMPSISLYYDPDNEEAIINTFGALLPQETREQDRLDKFMHRIRF